VIDAWPQHSLPEHGRCYCSQPSLIFPPNRFVKIQSDHLKDAGRNASKIHERLNSIGCLPNQSLGTRIINRREIAFFESTNTWPGSGSPIPGMPTIWGSACPTLILLGGVHPGPFSTPETWIQTPDGPHRACGPGDTPLEGVESSGSQTLRAGTQGTTQHKGRSSHFHILCLRKWFEYDSCLACQDSQD
jgi:hypothetical protein